MPINDTEAGKGGIVLFAKRPGFTSFSSLFTIKHALKTSKVGHTGTLDSFASGLLVVCTGPLTRLASRITEFDKTYDAVIEFGSETDTLEWTGREVRSAPLPDKEGVMRAIHAFTGSLMQKPPLFSAIHVNGERASSIARSGRDADIPARPVTVYAAEPEEFADDGNGRIRAVRIRFSVSKGTYIRSLARDIGSACGSAAHLAGLRRLSVGSFLLADAAGAELLGQFTIQSVHESNGTVPASGRSPGEEEPALQQEVRTKLRPMTESLASECGFAVLHLISGVEEQFRNGKPASPRMFSGPWDGINKNAAVFSASGEFEGVLNRGDDGRYAYAFVMPNSK